jgi:hypothetical protein
VSTRDDDTLGLVLLGGGVAAAGALAWRVGRPANAATEDTARDTAWIHPVPTLGERQAVVSNPFRARVSADGKTREHLGVDLMYRRRDARDLIAAFPAGTPGGTPLFFMPEGVPVLATSAGVVTFARATPVGNTVILRHPSGWVTYYTHLATLAVSRNESVAAGQPIGTIGASPQDAARVRHLHLELWKDSTRSDAVDPEPYLAAWSRVVIASWAPAAPSALTPRNGGLVYRPVGERGESYPEWLRRVRGSSGVYVIRERGGPVLYVGQSSANKLYETLTRHFQTWRRFKSFWRDQYAEGHDPGLTYDRASVEVAVDVTTPSDALDREARLIQRLRPRDNLIGNAIEEEVPF